LPDSIGAEDLAFLVGKALEALEIHRDEINALNVFPVPDGDTGTNMLLTVQAVMEEISRNPSKDMAGTCRAISRGSLMGARGNSGVVLSQILKGFCEVLQEKDSAGVKELSKALSRGSEVAYRAVMRPVEGTILTVVREAAAEGEALAGRSSSIEEWLEGVLARARQALELTPELLPVLKEAGVVDAGGRGLVAFLEGMRAGLAGEELERKPPVAAAPAEPVAAVAAEEEEGRYEIQFMLRCRDSRAEVFREQLRSLGTSVLVVGGDKTYRVHVHTDALGRVIEEASRIGRLSQVEVTDLREQVEELAREPRQPAKPVGLVAVAVGEGIKQVLRSMGVDIIVNGGQSMNPSTAEMLKAIERVPQAEVLVIPNNKNIIPAAEQTRELTPKKVGVVPAKAITEGFASLVAFDPRGDWQGNLESMTRACSTIRTGAITRAVRDSKSGVGKIKKGDYIGLYRGKIVAAGKELGGTTIDLIHSMLDGDTEIITFIVGEEADPASRDAVLEALRDTGLEVEVVEGGQPVYHFIIGAE
jgi:DAK2 domain fusion protein YloV